MIGYDNAESLYSQAHEKKAIINDDFSPHAAIMQNPRVQKEYLDYLSRFTKQLLEKIMITIIMYIAKICVNIFIF